MKSMQGDPGEASRAVVQQAREAGVLRDRGGGSGERDNGANEDKHEDEDEDEDEDEEGGDGGGSVRVESVAESLRLPISHEALLSGHRKVGAHPTRVPTEYLSWGLVALLTRLAPADGDVCSC